MTTPEERTRALVWAGDLLREIRANDMSTDKIRRRITSVLRHYPSEEEIERLARRDRESAVFARSALDGPLLVPWHRGERGTEVG